MSNGNGDPAPRREDVYKRQVIRRVFLMIHMMVNTEGLLREIRADIRLPRSMGFRAIQHDPAKSAAGSLTQRLSIQYGLSLIHI